MMRIRRGEEVAGVECRVAVELERRTVKVVGSALGHDVDDCTGRSAILGREVRRLDLELGDGLEGRAHCVALPVVEAAEIILVPSAVENESILETSVSEGRERTVARARVRDRAGRQVPELEVVPAVEGKLLDRLFVYHLAEVVGFFLKESRLARDRDGLVGAAWPQLEAQRDDVVNPQVDSLCAPASGSPRAQPRCRSVRAEAAEPRLRHVRP